MTVTPARARHASTVVADPSYVLCDDGYLWLRWCHRFVGRSMGRWLVRRRKPNQAQLDTIAIWLETRQTLHDSDAEGLPLALASTSGATDGSGSAEGDALDMVMTALLDAAGDGTAGG